VFGIWISLKRCHSLAARAFLPDPAVHPGGASTISGLGSLPTATRAGAGQEITIEGRGGSYHSLHTLEAVAARSSQDGEGDRAWPLPDKYGCPGFVGRGPDRGEQVGASSHIERLSVWSDSEGKRLVWDRNGNPHCVGRYTNWCHRVAT